ELDDRLLHASDAGLVPAHELRLPAMPLGIAEIHAQELRGKERGLLSPGAGPDLEDHVALVRRVARQQEHLQLVEEAGLVGLEPIDLVAGHRPELVVALAVTELTGAGKLGAGVLERPIRPDHGLEARELASEAAQ